MNKIHKTALVVLQIAIIGLVIVNATYAYFKATTTENVNQTLSATAGTMKLTLSDGDGTSVNASLNFGESKETYFMIENTGSLDAYAKICWKDLINTYLEGSLVYTLEYHTKNDDTYVKVVDNKNVPRSSVPQVAELKNGLLIPAGEIYYYKLTITLVNSETVDQTEDLTASFVTGFTIEDGTTPTFEIINGDLDTVGSEVAIGTEHFNVISSDSTNVNLLAKYNLGINAGQCTDSKCGTLEDATEMQDSRAIGYKSKSDADGSRYGTLAFSSTNYWFGSNKSSIYGTSYPAYVYDSNSYLYNYVESYVSKINTEYSAGATGRLMSYEEASSITGLTGIGTVSSTYSWLYNTTFWLGSAKNDNQVWSIGSNADFSYNSNSKNDIYGVRPLITVSKSLF